MPTNKDSLSPAWLQVARKEYGVEEKPGRADNPRIKFYHSFTAGGESPDSVPWCASFACACLELAGILSPRSKAAASFRQWGEELEFGELGCIVVMTRTGGNHVGFYIDENDFGVLVLGGNQSDKVCDKWFPWEIITNFRWPKETR